MIFVFKGYTVVYPLAIFSWSQHHRAFISRNIQPSNKPNMLCIYIYFYLVCSVAVKRYEHDEKLECDSEAGKMFSPPESVRHRFRMWSLCGRNTTKSLFEYSARCFYVRFAKNVKGPL